MIASVQGSEVQVSTNSHSCHQNAGEETTYQFRQRTRIKLNASVNVDVNMDVDAMNIGTLSFSLEIEKTEDGMDIELNMTARQTEVELGVEAGKTVRARVRAIINYGFAIKLEANKSCHAKLGIAMAAEEANGKTWAYFDELGDEWIPVETEDISGE